MSNIDVKFVFDIIDSKIESYNRFITSALNHTSSGKEKFELSDGVFVDKSYFIKEVEGCKYKILALDNLTSTLKDFIKEANKL